MSNNLWQTILASIMQNGGQGQIVDFALNWLFNQPKAIAFCKFVNWDINHLKNAIKGGISYVSEAYSKRETFAKTETQRMEDCARVFTELQGFNCLTNQEAQILATKFAGFNAVEAWKGLGLQNSMNVERFIEIGNQAHEKYMQVAKQAGVGVSANGVEPSSNVDLKTLFSKLSEGEQKAQ